jgi:hypothetical protein
LIASHAKVDFRIDGHVSGQCNLPRLCRLAERADEAGRPAGREQLLGVGAVTCRARGRQADIEPAVVAARGAVTAAGGVGLAGVEDFSILVMLGSWYRMNVLTRIAAGPYRLMSKVPPARFAMRAVLRTGAFKRVDVSAP